MKTSSDTLFGPLVATFRKECGTEVWCAYTACLFLICLMAHNVAAWEFSSVLTVSTFFQCLALMMIVIQISASGSVKGISLKTMYVHAAYLVCRLSSTLFLEGYLPLDASGDYVYQIADLASLAMTLKIIHMITCQYRSSYEELLDDMNIKHLAMGCVALAVLVHPHLNGWAPFDIPWAAGLYLETLAMLPQLWMVQKSGGCQAFTAHFIFATLMSRGFSAAFWLYGAENIARQEDDEGSFGSILYSLPAMAIVLAHVLQFLFLADFGYYYVKATLRGGLQSFSGALNIQEV